MARGDWHPDTVPAFDLDTWRAEDVHERRELIEALGDSNPPAMAEVIGHMLLASADTHPKGGDAAQTAAPFMSGAVGAEGAETPTPPPESHP